jgi:type I restriction enzyme R subunit
VGGFGGVQEPQATYGRSHKGLGWRRIASADFPRQHQDVLVEPWVSEALIRLNPEIAAQPDRADEALYKLRAIVLSVRSDGLIRANEEMMAWLRGERSMPFGRNNEHVPVRCRSPMRPTPPMRTCCMPMILWVRILPTVLPAMTWVVG